jgi:hypothetical protein
LRFTFETLLIAVLPFPLDQSLPFEYRQAAFLGGIEAREVPPIVRVWTAIVTRAVVTIVTFGITPSPRRA